ncbi:MAG: outer membrane protein assembly factor BamB [Gammaproteobacteria bacterium]|nr:outer membrane protein assembly factor BamB [Gammaproteobacteria bacterium]
MMRYLLTLVMWLALAGCSTSPSPVLPPTPLLPLDNSFSIQKRWSVKFGEGTADQYLHLPPVFSHHIGYVVDRLGMITAFEDKSGAIVWQRDTKLPFGSTATIVDTTLLLGTSHGEVVAIDASNGTTRWISHVSSEVLAPPQASKEIVVVRCVDGSLYGLNLTNGERLWTTEQRTPALTLRGTSAPVITHDIVLAGYDTGNMVAYSLQSGKLLWQTTVAASQGRTDLERMIDIDADPIVSDDVVYVVAYQGRLAALQLGSGQILWTRDLESYVGMNIDAYRIYLTASDGVIWALDRNNGSTLWKQDGLLRRAVTRPQLQKQYLIVGDFNGYLHWLRRDTGKIVARKRLLETLEFEPQLDNDIRFAKQRSIFDTPVLDGDRVVGMDRQGHIEAFDINYPN